MSQQVLHELQFKPTVTHYSAVENYQSQDRNPRTYAAKIKAMTASVRAYAVRPER